MKTLIVLATLTSLACTTGGTSDSIVVAQQAGSYVLTVPVSKLILTIPKEGFRQMTGPRADATANRRYFLFEDPTQHLFVSGWFEAQSEFPGTSAYWEMSKSEWSRTHVPAPTNVVFKKVAGWDVVAYEMPRSTGSNSNLQVHWAEAGTWINLHLSLDSEASDAENHRALESLLTRIRVSAK